MLIGVTRQEAGEECVEKVFKGQNKFIKVLPPDAIPVIKKLQQDT